MSAPRMISSRRSLLALAAGLGLLGAAPGAARGGAAAEHLLVKGGVVHTMDGASIEDGWILVHDGRIARVGRGPAPEVPAGTRTLEAAVVVPGLIDARTVVGLAGQYNTDHDQDQLERSAPIQPELRAIDAYNPRERLVGWVRSFGVTTIHTGHAPGELVSGQTMIAKAAGDTVDAAAVRPFAMVAATLGPASTKSDGKSPGTRSKVVSLLRAELVAAQELMGRQARTAAGGAEAADADAGAEDAKAPKRDLRKEALAAVLRREVPLLVHADRAQDIASALRLAEEFGIRMVLDGGAEAYLLIDELRAADVPVIVHPTMMRMFGEAENASMTTAAKLMDAGIPVAFQSGYESYVPKTRIVLFEAAMASVRGCGFERALRACTIDAARILGIDDRVGSITVGKDADLALYDGDPFEYATHCVGTVIGGVPYAGE